MRICNCSLPIITGGTKCCESCNNRIDDFEYNVSDAEKYYNYLKQHYNNLKKAEEKVIDNRPSWNDTFIEIAKVVSKRSKDPHTKVGAVLVNDNHILSIGYNGEPRCFNYKFDWNTSEKYDFVIHAEMNAIANACAIGANPIGSDVYLTLSPCHDCMKLLIQYQIKNVYFLEKYKDFEKSKLMADNSNINLIQIKSKGENKNGTK